MNTISNKHVEDARNIHNFLRLVYRLKTTKRTGWVNHEVNLPESIADHLFGIALLAMVIPDDQNLDKNRHISLPQ